ncbi:hypothetical protein BGW80DRAFT_852861 [Lactifluus volemus]|nr:hypothetical protein BGW80DRAFT_852861 [Lactifluus volemus]
MTTRVYFPPLRWYSSRTYEGHPQSARVCHKQSISVPPISSSTGFLGSVSVLSLLNILQVRATTNLHPHDLFLEFLGRCDRAHDPRSALRHRSRPRRQSRPRVKLWIRPLPATSRKNGHSFPWLQMRRNLARSAEPPLLVDCKRNVCLEI